MKDMKDMKTVTFLMGGDVTWTSQSGGTERRRHIPAGTKMRLRVVKRESEYEGEYELWDGRWSILVPSNVVRIEL